MSNRLIARRYAKALLELAAKAGSVEQVQAELAAIQDLVRAHPDLQRLVSARLIGPGRKAETFDTVLALGKASDLVRRFFKVVAGAARLDLFHDLVASFHELVDARMGVVEAHVTTAHPLSESQATSLRDSLTRRSGKTIRLRLRQDAALLGGLKVQLGSTVYDASLRGQLEQLKTRLLSA